MKRVFLLCCLTILISCNTTSHKPSKPDFLIGNWVRLNDTEGNKTFETWKTDFTGMGFSIKDEKTTFKELMSIVEINDTLHLKVSNVGEKPVFFKFTQQTDTSFVCENPQNEFPKKIHYYIENQQLKAVISDNEFRIDFVFEKVK